jgi:hypothetical protein
MVSVLDLEQYHPRSEDQATPHSGPPDDTDVSLSTMSISSGDRIIKPSRPGRLDDLVRWGWWVEEDLNLRPHAYQACALTT